MSGETVSVRSKWTVGLVLCGITLLAVLPYIPVLSQPFISDDYLQIFLGRNYGPVSGWQALASDALYRARAVSLVMTYWTERLFGFWPLPFYLSSILLHVVNCWLVLWLGCKLGLGRRAAACAAAFFAIYEGHQEAVMWYAALPELTVFAFVSLTALLWIRFEESGRRPVWLAAALAAFALALASKESAVVTVALLVLVSRDRLRMLPWAAPFAALAILYTAATFAAHSTHQHFNDGTFSLSAPFLLTLANSFWRLFWFWGLIALAVLAVWRQWAASRVLVLAAVWIVIALLPYSFLTYMTRVPSRHTYLASAGVAWIVGLAFVTFESRLRTVSRFPVHALLLVAILHNCGYVWMKKRAQFLERAAPTEALVALAQQTRETIHIRCFPYNLQIAKLAVDMSVKEPPQLVWESEHDRFSTSCLSIHPYPVASLTGVSVNKQRGGRSAPQRD